VEGSIFSFVSYSGCETFSEKICISFASCHGREDAQRELVAQADRGRRNNMENTGRDYSDVAAEKSNTDDGVHMAFCLGGKESRFCGKALSSCDKYWSFCDMALKICGVRLRACDRICDMGSTICDRSGISPGDQLFAGRGSWLESVLRDRADLFEPQLGFHRGAPQSESQGVLFFFCALF